MAQDPRPISVPMADARRVLLVRAVEEIDKDHRLLKRDDRDRIESEALCACPDGMDGEPDNGRFIVERARKMAAHLQTAEYSLHALLDANGYARRLSWILVAAAFLAGIVADRIAGGGRVHVLSLPLLGVIAWNMAVYLFLLSSPFFRTKTSVDCRQPNVFVKWFARIDLRRHGASWRLIVVRYQALLWEAARGVMSLEVKKWMHAAAFSWALGTTLSVVAGGLVTNYRVDWESTWLDSPAKAHAVLSFVYSPATHLLPFGPITLEEVAAMQVGVQGGLPPGHAQRWILMLLATLLLLVMIPRLLLFLHARWKLAKAEANVKIDLSTDYFSEVLARALPVSVVVVLFTSEHRGREWIYRVFRQASSDSVNFTLSPGKPARILRSSRGDSLYLLELRADATVEPATPSTAVRSGWVTEARSWWNGLWSDGEGVAVRRALSDADLVLAVTLFNESPPSLAAQLGKPLIHLHVPDGGISRSDLETSSAINAFSLSSLAGSTLADDLLRRLFVNVFQGSAKSKGVARLVEAWEQCSAFRHEQCLRLISDSLCNAGRETETVEPQRWWKLADRELARQHALFRLLARVDESMGRASQSIWRLHGLDPVPDRVAMALVSPSRADSNGRLAVVGTTGGVAVGAATGALIGSHVDALSGGLTLGIAAALGGLMGAGASVASSWDKRSEVQLSDEMMDSLVELSLLNYLAVIHAGRILSSSVEVPHSWRGDVVAVIAWSSKDFRLIWDSLRTRERGRSDVELVPLLDRTLRRLLPSLDSPA